MPLIKKKEIYGPGRRRYISLCPGFPDVTRVGQSIERRSDAGWPATQPSRSKKPRSAAVERPESSERPAGILTNRGAVLGAPNIKPPGR